MTYRLAKISSKRFFKNLKNGHKVRPIYESDDLGWNEDDKEWERELIASESKAEYAQRIIRFYKKHNIPVSDFLLDPTGANL